MSMGFKWLWLSILAWSSALVGVQVNVELDPDSLVVGKPVTGSVWVVHTAAETVDTGSVAIGGLPLAVEKIADSAVGGNIKTQLRFALPEQPAGLHLLPVLTIKVGGKPYATVSQAYSVHTAAEMATKGKLNITPPAVAVPPQGSYGTTPKGDAWIKFESVVDGPTTLYPGQTTKIGYRYLYRGSIRLESEDIPLLKAEGFRKVGAPRISEYIDKSFNTRQAIQQIEAVDPGEFHFPEGRVKGYIYNTLKQAIPVEATSAPLTLEVKSFPTGGKPTSFNGAVGNFEFKVRLLSLSEVTVGDKLAVSVDISGPGDLSDVPMPEICCQPGMSGNFQQSDIPPIGVVKGQTKYFVVDIRPLSPLLKAIPSLEFSFWNPEESRYVTLHSDPIPITVHAANTPYSQALQDSSLKDAPGPEPILLPPGQTKPAVQSESWPDVSAQPAPLEIVGSEPLESSDLKSPYFGNAWVLLLAVLVLTALWYQYQLKRSRRQPVQTVQEAPLSKQWLQKAEQSGDDMSGLYHALERAFLHLLYEKHLIESPDLTSQQLPEEGITGRVRTFLSRIEEQHYTGQLTLTPEQIMEQAKQLFSEITQR